MKCYLAIDKGKGTLPEDQDRYVLIDVSKLGYTKELSKGKKVINEPRDYFSSLEEAINFTSKYDGYSDLFTTLYDKDLIDKTLIGKPFTYCYYSAKKLDPKKSTWKHYGEKELINYDKVIFSKNAFLFDNPEGSELEEVRKRENNKKLPLTDELLGLELYIPDYFDLNSEKMDSTEKKKYYFIKALVEKFTKMINEKKKARIFDLHPLDGILNDYTNYVCRLEGLVKELNSYLVIAKNDHTVESELFYDTIPHIINGFCIKKIKEKYTIDTSALFDIASFCIAYREKIGKRHSVEIAKVQTYVEQKEIKKKYPEFTPTYGEQMTFFDYYGEEIYTKERKKGNNN